MFQVPLKRGGHPRIPRDATCDVCALLHVTLECSSAAMLGREHLARAARLCHAASCGLRFHLLWSSTRQLPPTGYPLT